jgi:glycosyltransferase involved in cell wall biosynthesis
VHFVSLTTQPGRHENVTCHSWRQISPDWLKTLHLDVLICISGADNGVTLRDALGTETRLVLWTQHRINQPAMETLARPEHVGSFDAFVFVSEWQREEFLLGFGLPSARTHVLANAPAPVFLNLFSDGEAILPQKARPPILAYTSTPFRGLNVLLGAFPLIRAQVPEVRLHVYSGMSVYHMPSAEEQKTYGALYETCRTTPGVEYIGSIPQGKLAQEMRGISVLAYPNTFPETSCIAALEAMASGCKIVTSALGALPETTAGFAELLPVGRTLTPDVTAFAERTVSMLRQVQNRDPGLEMSLRSQVNHIHRNATWELRSKEWEAWLRQLCGKS